LKVVGGFYVYYSYKLCCICPLAL